MYAIIRCCVYLVVSSWIKFFTSCVKNKLKKLIGFLSFIGTVIPGLARNVYAISNVSKNFHAYCNTLVIVAYQDMNYLDMSYEH